MIWWRRTSRVDPILTRRNRTARRGGSSARGAALAGVLSLAFASGVAAQSPYSSTGGLVGTAWLLATVDGASVEAGYAIDGTILSLADSTGRVLLTFDAMAPSILDGVWDVTMVNVGNGGVSAVPEGMRATLAFNADGTIEGSDACDSFFGGYSIDGSALAVDSEVGNTPIACDEATNAFAQRYLTALHLATTWAITPDALDLRDGSGALQVEATRAVGQ